MDVRTERWNQFLTELKNVNKHLRIEDLIYSINISLRNKYIYVETPKVGCSTIKKMLIQGEYGKKINFTDPAYIHLREFSPLLNIKQVDNFSEFVKRGDMFKFCFVRNPYTRILSAYLDRIKSNKPKKRQIIIQNANRYLSGEGLSFSEFVDAIVEQPIMYMDIHWRVQYYQTFQEGIKYDFIGKFETFKKDLGYAIEKTGIDFQKFYEEVRPHATNAEEYIQKYYVPELAKKIYNKYRIDFEYFGYKEELQRGV